MPTYCYPYKRGTGWRSQGFRTNRNQGANGPGGHTGYDQAMDAGTPIYAPGDGIVRNSSWVTDNYLDNPWWLTQMGGDILVLDCTDAFGRTDTMPTFIFAHLSDSIAEVGQRVRKGQLIALSGNSGTASTGPHLHTEALPPGWDFNNGVYGRVNPEQYFTEWPEDIPSPVETQGITIEEDPFMAYTDKERAEILAAARRINRYLDRPIGNLPGQTIAALLAEPVKRKGGRAGVTTFGNTLAYLDANLDAAKAAKEAGK